MKDTGQVYFTHMRLHDDEGNIYPNGGVTIAFTFEEKENTGVINYAVAICSKFDGFEKRQGRVKSAGRLKSPHHAKAFQVNKDITVHDAVSWLRSNVIWSTKVKAALDVDNLY